MRRDGKSLGQMAKEETGPVTGVLAMVAVLAIMVILLAVLALVVVNALKDSPLSGAKSGNGSAEEPGIRKGSIRGYECGQFAFAKSKVVSHMVRYRRNFVAGGTYFFTATLVDRTSRTLLNHVDALRQAFRKTRQSQPFVIDAVVVTPDHLHVVMTLPDGDADYTNRWRLIKRRFTEGVAKTGVSLPRHRNGEYALWQRRFCKHTVRDERDFERHVDYIHFNPVKHGLVTRVGDWPHSSFHRYVRHGLLPRDWAGDSAAMPADFGERRS